MFKVHGDRTLERVNETSFGDIHWRERQDLQECIVAEPTILGEELLIIQKEFSDFDNTSERLDLLALDKDGNLVIIENKLDDTGRDVVWQAVKYASYCSTLSTIEIKEIFEKYINKHNLGLNAEQSIIDFLNIESLELANLNKENTQRIMLVAREFRKEVLSAALWLYNYGIDISCVKIVPLKIQNEIFLDSRIILPVEETKDYTIKLADKAKEAQNQQKTLAKSEQIRSQFWETFIPYFNQYSELFKTISYKTRKDHWLGTAARMVGGVSYNFLICKSYCGVELTIETGNGPYNKKIFDALASQKQAIEAQLSKYAISWERLDHARMSRIAIKNENYSVYDKDNWDNLQQYLKDLMIDFESVFKQYKTIVQKVKL